MSKKTEKNLASAEIQEEAKETKTRKKTAKKNPVEKEAPAAEVRKEEQKAPEKKAHKAPAKRAERKETPDYEAIEAEKRAHRPEVNFGTPSLDIIAERNNEKTPEEIEFETLKLLKVYEKNKEVLMGTVIGAEDYEHRHEHVIIAVLWNNVTVYIPDSIFFEKNYDFGKRYPTLSPEEQFARRAKVASEMYGAKVYFTITAVENSEITEGEFQGKKLLTAIGNRNEGMEILRDVWFWHKQHKNAYKQPRELHENDIVYANVLSVKEEVVLVECAGVETRLGCHNLLPNKYADSCRDYVKPGDRIETRVKHIYLNDDGSVHLSLTGKLLAPTKQIATIKEGNTYLGIVEKYNPEKKCYSVNLLNGVMASVAKKDVAGGISLSSGDRVRFYVSNKYETFLSGSATKI